jgi:hypothetical protein
VSEDEIKAAAKLIFGLCGIENYQTLCVPCHKAKTAKLAKDRSEARRREKKEGA